MVKFGHFLMKKFFETVPKNPKIFMELFFWKDNKEIFELSEGYGAVRRQGYVNNIDFGENLPFSLL